jgi:hypothetical protein
MTDTPWFETFRIIALTLIYLMFIMQLISVHLLYRQFRRWAEDEAARRERWKEDMKETARMREESYHLRAQAEVALAQARQQILASSRLD